MEILNVFFQNKPSLSFYFFEPNLSWLTLLLLLQTYIVKSWLPQKMANRESLCFESLGLLFRGLMFGMALIGFLLGVFLFDERIFFCEKFPRSDDNLEDYFLTILDYLFFIFKLLEAFNFIFILINKDEKKIEDRLIYRHLLEVFHTYVFLKYARSSILFYYCFSHAFFRSIFYAYQILNSADKTLRPKKKWKLFLINSAIFEYALLTIHAISLYLMSHCKTESLNQVLLLDQFVFGLIMLSDALYQRKLFKTAGHDKSEQNHASID